MLEEASVPTNLWTLYSVFVVDGQGSQTQFDARRNMCDYLMYIDGKTTKLLIAEEESTQERGPQAAAPASMNAQVKAQRTTQLAAQPTTQAGAQQTTQPAAQPMTQQKPEPE